jgi:hypothetical protein
VPKVQHDVSYGPVYAEVVEKLDCPLGGEPIHSDEPKFDLTDNDVYGPFVTDDCTVVVEYVPWPDDMSAELAALVAQPGELTQEIPVVSDDQQSTVIAAVLGKLDGTERTAVSVLTGLSDQTLTDLGGLSSDVTQ